jgi:N-acyl-D-amino-acid deacylase
MSHLRSEDDGDLDAAIDELILQGEYAKVHIAHIKSVYGRDAARGQAIIEKLASARAAGVDITADFYPYIASYTSVSLVFPVWAKTVPDFERTKTGRRDELLDHLRRRVNARNGPAAMLLKAVAEQLGKPFEEVLVDDLGPGGGSAAYFVMNKALQSALLKGDMVMVGSDGSPTGFHPRGHGTVARVIEQFVMADQAFSLEEAVKKMTSMPASVLGLSNRGSIAPGKVADLVIFDPSKVKETATFARPHQLAEGFDWVLIDGEVARREGVTLPERHGRVLRPNP